MDNKKKKRTLLEKIDDFLFSNIKKFIICYSICSFILIVLSIITFNKVGLMHILLYPLTIIFYFEEAYSEYYSKYIIFLITLMIIPFLGFLLAFIL